MKKSKVRFVCKDCEAQSEKWLGRCPVCGAWGTMEEAAAGIAAPDSSVGSGSPPVLLGDVAAIAQARRTSHSAEFDRVLGGGFVTGEVVLIGGDPGIGKSTLLLQTACAVAATGAKVLYVAGEESAGQVRLRADRLGVASDGLYVLVETDLERIATHVERIRPILLIVDSIQTMSAGSAAGAPGSTQQLRECTQLLVQLTKGRDLSTCVVGHVTKDGAIAGPKLLEHMVDAVLYFEGDRDHAFRILRAAKNRFGSTNEIGVFDMQGAGLVDVRNPSQAFLEQRAQAVAGSAVVAVMEGSRPLLAEVQALVVATPFGGPRRTAEGLDQNRLALLAAVLDRRAGVKLQNADVYVKVAGGLRIDDPAADLGIALAIASSAWDRPLPAGFVACGEVGLTGEVRRCGRILQRAEESARIGFATLATGPRDGSELAGASPTGLRVAAYASVRDAFAGCL
ncbi:MAG: DNA repair protein RadA [Firmicutes bacterium]|nr:DNA repair protein RadA [Bacillota bacterium]